MRTSSFFHPSRLFFRVLQRDAFFFFIFYINSQRNSVPNGQGGGMQPAPHVARAKREPSIPGCSLGGRAPARAAGSGAFPTRSLSTRTTQILAAPSPPATEHGSAPKWMLSALGLKSQPAQIPFLPSHEGTAVAPMHPVPLAS